MRCMLLVVAALALWPPAAAHAPPPAPAQMDHIKRQILAKLGLTARPVPQRAPPRDVVRQILARAADPAPPAPPDHARDDAAREIIAIAHTVWRLAHLRVRGLMLGERKHTTPNNEGARVMEMISSTTTVPSQLPGGYAIRRRRSSLTPVVYNEQAITTTYCYRNPISANLNKIILSTCVIIFM